jgi:cytochrome c oxidase subunit II
MFASVQSARDPAGRSATWIGKAASIGAWRAGRRFALPALGLGAVLVYTLIIGEAFSQDAALEPLRVELTSRQSWWEVRYESRNEALVLAHELRVPVRRPVELIVSAAGTPSARVRIPDLAVASDGRPGEATRLRLMASHRGVFASSEGGLAVIAEAEEEFDEWLARQAAPSVTPTHPALREGRAAFLRAGCDRCHAIRGTAAHGRRGPDLTHFGARRAATGRAFDEHLASSARRGHDKGELQAIGAYLASLK